MRKFHVIDSYLNSGVVLPKRQTSGSGGYDLSAIEAVSIKPKEVKMIMTGLKVEIPSDEVMMVFPRSSLGIKKHVMMANNVGVIDSDYYNSANGGGHIMIPLYNFGDNIVTIEKHERIAQGIFVKFGITTDDEPLNEVRTGGFGSTDK